jgi:hypothetical protein
MTTSGGVVSFCAMNRLSRTLDDGAPAPEPVKELEADLERCDVCGERVGDDDTEDGFAVRGSALYVWTRGTEVRYEEPPLCASCAAAIGLHALARWETEEEEG